MGPEYATQRALNSLKSDIQSTQMTNSTTEQGITSIPESEHIEYPELSGDYITLAHLKMKNTFSFIPLLPFYLGSVDLATT